MAKPSLLSTRYCPRCQSGTDSRSLTGAPQVRARYIAGLPEVSYSMSSRASGKPPHQTSRHQARAIRHDLQHSPRCRERAQLAATLAGGITDCICRLRERPSPRFAPCLLGCRGTARQRPSSHGTRPRGQPYRLARRGTWRHMMIRGKGVKSNRAALNPRVRGSSPWRRTRPDLGFYLFRPLVLILRGAGLGPSWGRHLPALPEYVCVFRQSGSWRRPLHRRAHAHQPGAVKDLRLASLQYRLVSDEGPLGRGDAI